jgi:hypothetical protein
MHWDQTPCLKVVPARALSINYPEVYSWVCFDAVPIRRMKRHPHPQPTFLSRQVEGAESQLELQQLRSAVEEIHRVIVEVADRGTAQEKVFDTLHAELQDYKNDFHLRAP